MSRLAVYERDEPNLRSLAERTQYSLRRQGGCIRAGARLLTGLPVIR